MGKKFDAISAAQARDLAITSLYTINHIYKEIKRASQENRISTFWSFNFCSEEIIRDVINELKEQGYTVQKPHEGEDYNGIRISW